MPPAVAPLPPDTDGLVLIGQVRACSVVVVETLYLTSR